jgi:hypothetical protein
MEKTEKPKVAAMFLWFKQSFSAKEMKKCLNYQK